MKNDEKRAIELARAIEKIGASELYNGDYIYRDDGMRAWYVCTQAELVCLGKMLNDSDDAIRSDAYSHWCAGTQSTEATPAQIAEAEGLTKSSIPEE